MKASVDPLILNCLLAIDLDLHSFQKYRILKKYSYRIYLNISPCFNNSPSPGLDVKNGVFFYDFLKF